MILLIINIAFVALLAGYWNGCMDWIKFNSLDSESWKNKWYVVRDYSKKDKPLIFLPYRKRWYYFGLHTPKYKERFPFSSTILVFLTDQWHFKKWCMFLCYEFALSSVIVYYESLTWWGVLVGILVLKIVRGLGFTLKYDKK